MKVEVALAEKKEVPPRFRLYQGEMGSGPSLGNVCFQVSFESALLSTSLESCLFCFISTSGLSAGANFSLYYRSNRCSLWTIVAQSYKFYLLILQAVMKDILWTIHNIRASCLLCPALSPWELHGRSGFEFNESWNKAVSFTLGTVAVLFEW